jgi:hypothetical protein
VGLAGADLVSRGRAPVAIGNSKFITQVEQITWRTVEVTRRGVDQGAGVGESSLSNEAVWRRTRESWHLGSGQEFADIPDESSPFRFFESHNCDPWTRRGLTLQHDTERKVTSANTNLKVLNVGSHLCIVDGINVRYTLDPTVAAPVMIDVTGEPGTTILDVAFDGTYVYICDGTGVWRATPGTNFVAWTTVDVDTINVCNGRLICTDANEIFELDSTGTKVTIFTHPAGTAWTWVGAVGTPGLIYAWGATANGNRPEIYAIGVTDATGALATPFVACPMPEGEPVRDMIFYGGVMCVATRNGLRLANITGGGFLAIAPVIRIAGNATVPGIECLEAQGEDVWFGWADNTHTHLAQTGSHSCLGRARLSKFTEDFVPAYAEDLVANNAGVVTGRVLSVCTFGGRRYFAISGSGFYGEKATYAASGDLSTGWFSFSTPENKQPDGLRVHSDVLNANTGVVGILVNDAATIIATATVAAAARSATAFSVASSPSERLRLRVTLTTSNGTNIPTVRRLTLGATPVPFISDEIILPIELSNEVADDEGARWTMDVLTEWNYLIGLRDTQERVAVAIGNKSYVCRVAELAVVNGGLGGGNGLDGWDDKRAWMTGTWSVRLITMEQ